MGQVFLWSRMTIVLFFGLLKKFKRIHRSYTNIAQKLNIPGWDTEKPDVKQLVKRHLSQRDANQSLLIFDSADEIDLRSAKESTARAVKLIDYLPQSESCSILFTTTSSDTAKRLASQNVIELQEMTPNVAQKMIERYLNRPVSKDEQPEAKLLLQELSYLPLAIVQAAAHINTKSITLHAYRSQLVRQKDLEEYDAEGPVATTLLLSIDEIQRVDPLAAKYLFFAACVLPKDISIEFLEASSFFEREAAIRTINSYALVTRRPAESALDLHQLVHRALRGWLRKQKKLDQWTQTAIAWVHKVFPNNSHGNRSKWRRMLPHATYALANSPSKYESKKQMDLVWKCAMALLSDGRYSESEELFVQSMEVNMRVLGDAHPYTLMSMANLAGVYWNTGRLKEAEELEVQVMETNKRVLGIEHPHTLITMDNLASTYRNQQRWNEAEEIEVQVLEISMRVHGDNHPETAISMINLASTYREQGKWKEAEELQVQALETNKSLLGSEHPDTVTTMANLASTYSNQGRYQEAEELEVQVMKMRQRLLGDEHPSTLMGIANLALTYQNQGRWEEAEELELRVIDANKRVLGHKHPHTLINTRNLASLYRKQGRHKEAEDLEAQIAE